MKPLRIPSLPWREIEGWSVIIHPKRGEVHELNPVASFLWSSADGSRSLEEIASAVADEFEVGFDLALEDTRAFFSSLTDRGLIHADPV